MMRLSLRQWQALTILQETLTAVTVLFVAVLSSHAFSNT